MQESIEALESERAKLKNSHKLARRTNHSKNSIAMEDLRDQLRYAESEADLMKQQLREGLMSAEEEAAAKVEREQAKHDLLQVRGTCARAHTCKRTRTQPRGAGPTSFSKWKDRTACTPTRTHARAHARACANTHTHPHTYLHMHMRAHTQAHELLKRAQDDEDNASATASSMYGETAGAGGVVAYPDAGRGAGVVALHDTRSSQELYDTIALGIDPDLDPMAQVRHTNTSVHAHMQNYVWWSHNCAVTITQQQIRWQYHRPFHRLHRGTQW